MSKQIMLSYFPMEEEKDNRLYGAIRGNMFRQVRQRWLECQKLAMMAPGFGGLAEGLVRPSNIYSSR